MIKRFLLVVVLLNVIVLNSFTQIKDPVKWSYSVKKITHESYDLKFTAKIDNTWHLYSQDIPENGPVSTSFQFEKSGNYELVGKPKELSKAVEKFDKDFQMNVKMFSNEAVFVQRIKVKAEKAFDIKGTVTFMSCDDNSCLPPKDVEFSFSIPATSIETSEASEIKDTAKLAAFQVTMQAKDTMTLGKDTSEVLSGGAVVAINGNENEEPKTAIGFLLWALLWGLAGVLTPCVYPMIPMTVSFFMRGEKRSVSIAKAAVFGLSIIAIYTLIGVLVSLSIVSANIGSILSTHWIPNLIFFLLFVVFAASFFGMFEMVLPGTLVNKIDQQAEKGGYLGAFFMALTLVIVSFSCTGPIVGKILIEASQGLAFKPIAGMFGYSLAFALPFTFFAIFPSLLKTLPKSGGWLNSVKVVLGFIVLAFSLTFVSAIDQNYNLGILSRELYIIIWFVIASLLGFYLLGKIKFAHDSDVSHVGVFRLLLVMISFVFALYLFSGLLGYSLKSIDWILPPQKNVPTVVAGNTTVTPQKSTLCSTPKYSNFLSLPHRLEGYFDYEEGIACAKQQNKPVFLDFKGHACKNCKKMEAEVWPDPRILETLRNDFVIIALYTDDRTRLPESEWITSTFDKEVKKTIGAKNLDMEITKFNTNTQPLYAIVDYEGSPLVKPMGMNLDANVFLNFLKEGKRAFDEKKPK